MEIIDERIDGGKAFDWGKTSKDYAMYRDIYPDIFYQKIVDRGLCIKGQNVLDLGTGTGMCFLILSAERCQLLANCSACSICSGEISVPVHVAPLLYIFRGSTPVPVPRSSTF